MVDNAVDNEVDNEDGENEDNEDDNGGFFSFCSPFLDYSKYSI